MPRWLGFGGSVYESIDRGLAEIDPWRSPLRGVGGIAALKHILWLQVGVRAVIERSSVDV